MLLKIKTLAYAISFIFLRQIIKQIVGMLVFALVFVFNLTSHFNSNNSLLIYIFSDIVFIFFVYKKLTINNKPLSTAIELWSPMNAKCAIHFIPLFINFAAFIGITSFLLDKPRHYSTSYSLNEQTLLGFYLVLISAPILEELLYRGIILNYLSTGFSIIQSILISSVAFGLMHFNGGFLKMAIVTIAGLYYSYVYLKYHSLVLSISLHMLNNIYNVFFTDALNDYYDFRIIYFYIVILGISGIVLLCNVIKDKRRPADGNQPINANK